MFADSIKTGTFLRAWNVTYVSGLPSKSKLLREIYMQLFTEGFGFSGNKFPDLWISHSSIVEFKLLKGFGDFWKWALDDLRYEKMIQIIFSDEAKTKYTLKLEMATDISPFAASRLEFHACKELISLMHSNGIFDKFASATPTAPAADTTQTVPSPDIMFQIEKLGELHKSGVLTDEEFQGKKEEFLKRL